MCTFSALASNSMLSSVGEYTSFAMLLIVDFEIPVIMESCRTEMFLSYIILFNNIFMEILFAKLFVLCFWLECNIFRKTIKQKGFYA